MLRHYQVKAKVLINDAFARMLQAVILCLPTGGGKTIIFADLTKDLIKAGYPVMIICNRKELIGQANKKLKKLGLNPTLIIPGYTDRIANLYIASIDTLRNRKLPEVAYVFIDECHIRAFDKIVLELKKQKYRGMPVKVVGFTATPIRYGKASIEGNDTYTGQLGDVYDEILIPTTVTELLAEAHLMPAITYGAPIDLEGVKKKGNDYDEAALFERFNKPKLYSGVVDNYIKFANGKKALVFCVNVEHSIKTCNEFISRGFRAWHVDGKTPGPERDRIFAEFAQVPDGILCNCSVATTGYDEPTIECVIIFRATMSLSLFLQMPGRGSRPWDPIGKTHYILIDQGSNIAKHGFWQQEREWSLWHKQGSSAGESIAPIKECESCGALIPASSGQCPHCNGEQPVKDKGMIEAEFELLDDVIPKELKKPLNRMSISEMERFRELKDYKLTWIVRQLMQRGEEDLREYARLRGFQESWVKVQLNLAEEGRIAIKSQVWDFVKANMHLDDATVSEEATKRLRTVYGPDQINFLIPKILQAKVQFKNGIITE